MVGSASLLADSRAAGFESIYSQKSVFRDVVLNSSARTDHVTNLLPHPTARAACLALNSEARRAVFRPTHAGSSVWSLMSTRTQRSAVGQSDEGPARDCRQMPKAGPATAFPTLPAASLERAACSGPARCGPATPSRHSRCPGAQPATAESR